MIADILPQGKQNRMSMAELQTATGCRDVRTLRKMISDERKQGHVILSCPEGGYWLPENRAEVEAHIKRTEKEAKSLLYALKGAREYLKAEDGLQVEMAEAGAV